MPVALVSAEVALGVVLLLLVVFLAATYARRRAMSHGATLLVLCGLRADPASRWRLGHLRLGPERLEWFRLIGASPRPQRTWDRGGVDLEAPRTPRPADLIDLLPDAAPVPCSYGSDRFELALTPDSYTALRSWAEAAPPGSAAPVS